MKEIIFDSYLAGFSDPAVAFASAVEELREGGVLRLSNRRYECSSDFAAERYCAPSNNDNGKKRILLPLVEVTDLTIEGNGAELLLNGKMMAGWMEHCRNITIRDLTVDFVRPFHSEGLVTGVGENCVTLQIDPEKYPFCVRNDRVFFEGHGWSSDRWQSILRYDPATRDLCTGAGDWYVFVQQLRASSPKKDTLILEWGDFGPPWQIHPGEHLVLGMEGRDAPGFAASECQNIRFEGVTLRAAYAMGFLFQGCENPTLSCCRVIPGEGRLISASADASHFVNCYGRVLVEDCTFLGQLDDAVNVHGIYTPIVSVQGRELWVRLVHGQQTGAPVYSAGDRIGFVRKETMQPFAEGEILSANFLNEEYIRIILKEPVAGLSEEYAAENLTRIPDSVEIKGCTTGLNRARSFLLSAGKKATIRKNDLHAAGSAIHIAGDANYWHEAGSVGEVEICENKITSLCKTPGWGSAAIGIVPEIPQKDPSYYHRRVSIHDNEFILMDSGMVEARAVETLEIYSNTITRLQGCRGEAEEVRRHCCGGPIPQPSVPKRG